MNEYEFEITMLNGDIKIITIQASTESMAWFMLCYNNMYDKSFVENIAYIGIIR